jgi:hypothetical protein
VCRTRRTCSISAASAHEKSAWLCKTVGTRGEAHGIRSGQRESGCFDRGESLLSLLVDGRLACLTAELFVLPLDLCDAVTGQSDQTRLCARSGDRTSLCRRSSFFSSALCPVTSSRNSLCAHARRRIVGQWPI